MCLQWPSQPPSLTPVNHLQNNAPEKYAGIAWRNRVNTNIFWNHATKNRGCFDSKGKAIIHIVPNQEFSDCIFQLWMTRIWQPTIRAHTDKGLGVGFGFSKRDHGSYWILWIVSLSWLPVRFLSKLSLLPNLITATLFKLLSHFPLHLLYRTVELLLIAEVLSCDFTMMQFLMFAVALFSVLLMQGGSRASRSESQLSSSCRWSHTHPKPSSCST